MFLNAEYFYLKNICYTEIIEYNEICVVASQIFLALPCSSLVVVYWLRSHRSLPKRQSTRS